MTDQPLISVVVPTYQRNDLLSNCLDRLAPGKQTLDPAKYEVVVTDDGKSVTAEKMIADQYPWARWVEGPHRGPAANRNNGAKHARGTWIAFIDDDCLADQGWLSAIAREARTGSLGVVEGKTIIPDPVDDPFKQGIENLTGGNFWSCNLAIQADRFREMGGFDEDFLEAGGEDMELGWRIRTGNIPSRFVEDALVLHPVRALSWKQVWWRTFLIRWLLLYRHKTGEAVPLSEGTGNALIHLLFERVYSHLRGIYHFWTNFDRKNWRTGLFWHVWALITFPLVLPYMLVWEVRFRRQLSERCRTNAGKPAS